ncbi:MAG: tripartite tricarboxylate transporter substrate binding protein [Methylobacterium sp.]|nr:tripartite tricarboxylate transporter substrate binding protein [Methylobacterium sp.]MCA3602206.1 tripartite tricarboxylate transporter substrate binding protein [Methylobacterium sp.]MCA3614983.1 tripartite tricarboxylate transporter substrate binding protein [Methylobacterium sp.]MCA4909776.1 tripartite tricarboxylate transporter substrate binding protein [Methylobacterium sp.]
MMTPFTRRALLAGAFALGLGSMASPALAQGFPTRAITIVVPFAAGGSTDIIARIIGQKMGELLGQNVVIENRAGAGGNLGSNSVAKAAPDGYTLLMGTISTHAINSAVFKTMPYDPVKDFSPVSLLVIVPNVMVVHPSVPAKNVQEMIALLKADPKKYSYASSGVGTPLHLSGELFKSMSGTEMQHIPYRGAGPALNDIVAGKVPVMFDNLPSATQHIQSGALRALAVTTKRRSPAMPDIPTMEEAGLPGYETLTWNALFAPPGTPRDVIAKLNNAANLAIADPAVAAKLRDLSATTIGSTPEQLGEHVKSELAKWGPIAKAAGASVE